MIFTKINNIFYLYMSHIGDSHLGSVSLFLQSDKASVSIDDSHKIFILDEIIQTDPHIKMLIGLTSFQIPYSFYNINIFNNFFEIWVCTSVEHIH